MMIPLPQPRTPLRGWGRILIVVLLTLLVYLTVSFGLAILTGSPFAAAACADVMSLGLVLVYRWLTTGTARVREVPQQARSARFWAAACAALVVSWMAGQTGAEWAYAHWGSSGFDRVSASEAHTPALLALLVTLVLAPIGEESLVRGIIYPALRTQLSPVGAAVISAIIFSSLHGNLVQIVVTIPLGILLALVYEGAGRIWPGVILHMLFNIGAVIVPASLVQNLAELPIILITAAGAGFLLWCLNPRLYVRSAAR